MAALNGTVPIWEKFALTINEAALYFGIGEKKLRQIVDEYNDSEFVLHNGVKSLIKRNKFEQFLNDISAI